MSVLPSLIAALERAAGDCLVLRSGERPHVVAGEARHDVGTTVLSVKAVEALAAQILSPGGHKELLERSAVQEVLGVDVEEGSLIARAERAGDDIYVELRRHRRAPKVEEVELPVVVVLDEPPAGGGRAAEPSASLEIQIVEAPLPETTATAEPPSFERPLAPATPHLLEAPAPVAHVEQSPVDEDAGLFALPPFIVERFEPAAPVAPIAAVAPAPAQPTQGPVGEAEKLPLPDAADAAVPVARQAPATASHVRRAPAPAASTDVLDVTDDLDELIADAAERGATALYLRAGQVPSARIDERLQRLDEAVVGASMLTEILASCTAGRDGWAAGEHGEWIREFDLAGLVRCYPFADQAGDGAVIRLTPRSGVNGLQRHIPRQVRRACESEDGLVLVAAATHPEVLAMTAAVADVAARKRAGYVICLQPNGLPHPISGAFVSERRLEGSADEVSARIRRAVQEAPDILVVGAVDSPVALEEVILSSATPGRLVILGVVAPTALRGVESVLATVGREREPQIRRALAAALRAAFGYRGLRRLGGGRTSVQDIVVGTSDVLTRLERADFGGIEQAQRQGGDGMRTLDAALARAVARRHVSLRQAAALATSKSDLVALTRRGARERRALAREHRSEWRQGALRAI